MLTKLLNIFIILFLSTTCSFAGVNSEQDAQTNFLVLTDIHFDPFIACYKSNQLPCPMIEKLQTAPASQWSSILASDDANPPAYRQDTNYSLLTSSLTAAKKAADAQHVQFVLVLGDMIGHDYRMYYKKYAQDKTRAGYQAFVKKTLEFLSSEVAHTFPSRDVYSLVGNNDSYRGDYYSNPHGEFFQETAVLWADLIKNEMNRAVMQREFPTGGYYAVNVPGQENMRLIMLNSVLFSNKANGENINQSANQELDWLHKELLTAKEKNQRVLIGMHIPVGIDVYSTLHTHFSLVEFWQPSFTGRFQAELKQFAPEIAGIFSGHLHADWFQVQRFDNFNEIPVLGTPAISPLFGNNPGFKIYSYSMATRQINDFITYYYPINESTLWKTEYEFSQVYKPDCHHCPIATGMNALQPTGSLTSFYKLYYAVGTTTQPITTQWNPYYWCAVHEVKAENYQKCVA